MPVPSVQAGCIIASLLRAEEQFETECAHGEAATVLVISKRQT